MKYLKSEQEIRSVFQFDSMEKLVDRFKLDRGNITLILLNFPFKAVWQKYPKEELTSTSFLPATNQLVGAMVYISRDIFSNL